MILAVVSLLLVLPSAKTSAQKAEGDRRIQVMVLGVYHFQNPNADVVKTNFPDHLSATKQKEIEAVLEALAKFAPTKIFVEAVPESQRLKENYAAYLKDGYVLTANETDQLGSRLAKRLGHKQVFGADHKIGMDINAVMAAANQTKNTVFLSTFQKVIAEVQAMQKRHESATVTQALTELNEPSLQERTKEIYLQMARVTNGESYVGADVLTNWYQRNFRIFSNIVRSLEPSYTRVLIIFGQGHAPYLRDAVMSSSDMTLIEPNAFLKARQAWNSIDETGIFELCNVR